MSLRAIVLSSALAVLGVAAATDAQVGGYGRRGAVWGTKPKPITIKGEVVAFSPRGFQVKLEQPLGVGPGALGPGGQQLPAGLQKAGQQQGPQQQAAAQDPTIFVPLARTTELIVGVQVADPTVVLAPGMTVELSGELEGPRGPISTGGMNVLVGTPTVRPGQNNPFAPNVRITPGQLRTDPASIWLRGRLVSLQPVVVAAGRYRFPLRLSDSPRITLRVYGRAGLALVKPGADITVTVEQVPRRPPVVTRIHINRREPVTAEELRGGVLKKGPRRRPQRGRKPAKSEKQEAAPEASRDEKKAPGDEKQE